MYYCEEFRLPHLAKRKMKVPEEGTEESTRMGNLYMTVKYNGLLLYM